MPYGFHNKILRVNLSNRQINVEQPGQHFYRIYFGGWGLIAYYLLKEMEPGTDPLGPDNVLIFANGVVTGTPVGGSGRNAVPIESGPNEGVKVPTENIAKALDLYYEMCGWDKETGAPTAGKLHELGIGWATELLYEG